MNNKTYDIIKWIVTVVLPALLVFFSVLGNTLNWNFTDVVMTIGTAFIAMLGTILGISSINYNKEK